MTTATDVLRRLTARAAGTGLPREFYSDPRIFQLDLELVYYREWLFAGHTAELAAPGAYLTLQVGAYPILLVRGRDTKVRAFINSCRHRGSRLCPQERGTAVKLVCPYHQWTYDLDGRLFAARQMGPSFDRGQYSLRSLPCEEVAGYVFVCLAAEPPDFAQIRQQLTSYVAPHRLGEARVAFESTIIEEGNWKLVWENNRECYHCAANHPELARAYPDAPAITAVGAATDPAVLAHWQRCEAAGLPSRLQLSADGQMRSARMPLHAGMRSYTRTGQAAVRRPLSDVVARAEPIGALLLFHYPSTWNHFLADHAITFRVLPLGPERTQLTTKWLVHKEAVEGRDYDLDELTHVWLATNRQDQRIVHENQIGMNTPGYEPGPLSSAAETGVGQFVDWYANLLTPRLATHELTQVA
jgi:glycine betaine catabolism A